MSLDTLNKIAREAGVSRWTVSRVLRGEIEYVRPHAVERAGRIRAAAERLGYRPNAAAQAVGRGRFDTIALLSNADDPEHLSGGLLFGLQRALAEAGQHLVFERLAAAQLTRPGAGSPVLRQASCDAILFHAVGPLPEAYEQAVARLRLPVVYVNSRRPADCCHYDDLGAARDATRHLIGFGHRRVTFLTVPLDPGSHYSTDDRREGYLSAMAEAGLVPRVVEMPVNSIHGHEPPPSRTIAPLLRGDDRPTAVVAIDRRIAGMVYVEAVRRRLSVPRDLSLIGFSGRMSNATGVRIGLCQLPEAELGRRAAGLALRKLSDPSAELPPEVVAIPFEPYDTVAAPPA